jgi:hypothetical protein
MVMPALQEFLLLGFYHTLDSRKFHGREAQILRKRNGVEPELRRLVVAVNVDVRWLIRLVAVEVEAIGTATVNRRHDPAFRHSTSGSVAKANRSSVTSASPSD